MALIFALALAQDYSFPTSVDDYGEFYPTAYYDHGGTTDWNCDSLTYSGHRGSDWGFGSTAGMAAGRDVSAAADGEVVWVEDGHKDDCSSYDGSWLTADCQSAGGGYGNYVKVEHPDGKETYYAHLKKFSTQVSVGDAVVCGQKLGEGGSSGYSTAPHLHFEVRSGGTAADPFDGACSFAPSWWVDQGVHGDLPGLACSAVECAPASVLSCGDVVTGANDGVGSTSATYDYGCVDFVYSGPELVYTFSTSLSEQVTLNVSGLSGDLDLFVVGSTACDGSDCIGASSNPDLSDESVVFDAVAGDEYTIVVDGWEGAVSGFTLEADCEGEPDTTTTTPADTGGDTGTTTPATDPSTGGTTTEPTPTEPSTTETEGETDQTEVIRSEEKAPPVSQGCSIAEVPFGWWSWLGRR